MLIVSNRNIKVLSIYNRNENSDKIEVLDKSKEDWIKYSDDDKVNK